MYAKKKKKKNGSLPCKHKLENFDLFCKTENFTTSKHYSFTVLGHKHTVIYFLFHYLFPNIQLHFLFLHQSLLISFTLMILLTCPLSSSTSS